MYMIFCVSDELLMVHYEVRSKSTEESVYFVNDKRIRESVFIPIWQLTSSISTSHQSLRLNQREVYAQISFYR